MKNYRNPKILALAGKCDTCQCCGMRSETIVAAHSNAQKRGKGTGLKAHDIPAYLCRECHDLVDRRIGEMPLEDRERMFLEAQFNTFLWLFREGFLRIVA